MANIPMIAAGHNNQAGLERWDKLDAPCRFSGYGKFIPQLWNSSESRERSGNRRYKRIGRPWVALTFPILYEEDLKYIFDTFTANGEDGLVTANVYNRDEMRWMNVNATLVIPEDRSFDVEVGYYTDVEIELRDIIEI